MTTRSGTTFTQAQRHKKIAGFTLSDEVRDALRATAERMATSQSALVEAMLRRELGLDPANKK